ncbi:hypothetical protein ABPG75_013805 [Micractinium tetrahymenae]
MWVLVRAAEAAASKEPGADGAQQSHLATLAAALAERLSGTRHTEFQHLVEQAQTSSPAGRQQILSQLEQAVPAAAELAAVLQRHWDQPEKVAAARLELAQAASLRACANLRCASVGAAGGMAAGNQVGSKRCGACRSVRYCGQACCRADWAAGHRRVCRHLAAANAAAAAAGADTAALVSTTGTTT